MLCAAGMRLRLLLVLSLAAAATAHADAPPTVPVTFLGRHSYHVLVGRRFCAAPCVLDLAPGPARLVAVTDAGYRQPGAYLERDILVPPSPTIVELNLVPSPRKAAGVVFASLGGAYSVAGGALFAVYAALRVTALLVGGAVFAPLGALFGIIGGALIASDHTQPFTMRPDLRF